MANDLTITVHALERFQERFASVWRSDQQEAQRIHRECQEAFRDGRIGNVAPIELAHNDPERWVPGKSLYAWTPDKRRGYVVQEDTDGMTVVTVLKGRPTEEARKKLYTNQKEKGE